MRFNKKQKILLTLILWLIFMIPVCLIVKNSAIQKNEIKDIEDDSLFYIKDITNQNGYEVSGNEFKLTGYDPGFRLENINAKITTVHIVFDKPLESDASIQIFYQAFGKELTEENSLVKYLYRGCEEVVATIPFDKYEVLRFDIDGSFSLRYIGISSKKVELMNHGEIKVSYAAYLVSGIFLAVFFFFLVFFIRIPEKIFYKINNIKDVKQIIYKYKTPLIFFIIYLAIFAGLFLLYKQGMTSIIPNRYVLIQAEAVLSGLFWILLHVKKMKQNIAFVVCGIILIMGLCYAVTLPVATQVTTDDEVHYRRAVRLSHIFDGYVTEADEYIYVNNVLPNYNQNSLMSVNTKLNELYKNGASIKIDIVPEGIYAAISYLPSAVGLLLGRGLGMTFAQIFIFGRIMNVCVYTILIYFALKHLKSGKLILSIIALLPTNIFMAASYGYDSWLTGFTIFSIAYIISIIQSEQHIVSKKDVAVMMVGFLLGLAPKAVYFPLMGLCFLIPAKNFKNKKAHKNFVICTIVCAIIVLSTFMLPFLVQGPGSGDMRGGAGVNSTEQVSFILKNPAAYTKILLNHMKNYLSVENQSKLIGSMMHMGDSRHFVLLFLTLTAAIFCDRNKEDDSANTIIGRTWALVVVLSTVVLISTALYISFTAVGSSVISGCQQRYLMPLIYPACYFVFNIKITNRSNMNILYTLGIGILFVILILGAQEQWINFYTT